MWIVIIHCKWDRHTPIGHGYSERTCTICTYNVLVSLPWASKPLKYPGFASKTEVRPGKPGFVEKTRFFQKHGFSLPYLFRFTIWILKTIPFLDVQNGYCKFSSSINSPNIFNVLGAHSNPWKNHGLSRVNHGSVTGKSRVGHYQVFP